MENLNIRPSNMSRVLACPGSARAGMALGPQAETEAQGQGKKLHEGMALMLRIGPASGLNKLAADPEWTAEDIRLAGEAYKFAKDGGLFPEGGELFVEEQLDMEFMGITEGERRVDFDGA